MEFWEKNSFFYENATEIGKIECISKQAGLYTYMTLEAKVFFTVRSLPNLYRYSIGRVTQAGGRRFKSP